jgi:hypothetical protein
MADEGVLVMLSVFKLWRSENEKWHASSDGDKVAGQIGDEAEEDQRWLLFRY